MSGHNPDLVIFKDQTEYQRIDLTSYKTIESLHSLIRSYNFTIQNARNFNKGCYDWAEKKQCETNPSFMYQICKKACKDMKIVHPQPLNTEL